MDLVSYTTQVFLHSLCTGLTSNILNCTHYSIHTNELLSVQTTQTTAITTLALLALFSLNKDISEDIVKQ